MPDPVRGESLIAWLAAADAEQTVPDAAALAAAEAWIALAREGQMPGATALASAVAGEATTDELEALVADPVGLVLLETAVEFANQSVVAAPVHLFDVARSILAPSAEVVAFRHGAPPRPVWDETFRLRAAASAKKDAAILCRSESGIWTLEVFVEQSDVGGAHNRASVLLSVDPEYHATYEGIRAKVFVLLNGVERVLADAVIRGGELFATTSLAGVDLHARDAINVTFGSEPDGHA